jgi:hypothetical protein
VSLARYPAAVKHPDIVGWMCMVGVASRVNNSCDDFLTLLVLSDPNHRFGMDRLSHLFLPLFDLPLSFAGFIDAISCRDDRQRLPFGEVTLLGSSIS